MAETDKTTAMLLDELVALDPPQRREVAAALRSVAETFAEVPDLEPCSRSGRLRAAFGADIFLLPPAPGSGGDTRHEWGPAVARPASTALGGMSSTGVHRGV